MNFGFWEEYKKFHERNKESYWSEFLESELNSSMAEVNCSTPYPNFIHGDCIIFAEYLHEKYGYDIECVYQKEDDEYPEGQLIHAYCITEIDGETYYIDIRGMNSDFNEFMKEFHDLGLWSNDDYSYFISDYSYFISMSNKFGIKTELDKEATKAAKQIDIDYPEYYNSKGKEEELEI